MSDEPLREVKNIHEAIVAIMEQVGYVRKTKSANLNYTYAGEAGLISALRPWMNAYGVYMYVSGISNVKREWYTTAKGSQMVNTTLDAIITFTHAPSGSSILVFSSGEGSDTGDKSQNKALTGAYKYALRQTFCIETGDDPDKESSDHMERSTEKKAPEKKAAGADASPKKTQAALVNYAASKGLDIDGLGAALGAAGFTEVDLKRWEEMVAAVDSYAAPK